MIAVRARLTWILSTASAMDLGACTRNYRPEGSIDTVYFMESRQGRNGEEQTRENHGMDAML